MFNSVPSPKRASNRPLLAQTLIWVLGSSITFTFAWFKSYSAVLLAPALTILASLLQIRHNRAPKQFDIEVSGTFSRLPVISYPKSREDVKLVNALARRVFPSSPPIDPERYEQWLLKNPHILVCYYDDCNDLGGYFDVLPFEDGFAEKFVDGLVTECDIRHEHLTSCSRAPFCKYVYLAGFAVEGSARHKGKRGASMLLWGLIRFLKINYGFNGSKRLLALAATQEGEDLLIKMQFQYVAPRFEHRKDGSKLYEAPMTTELYERLSSAVPDYSRMCELDFVRCEETLWDLA